MHESLSEWVDALLNPRFRGWWIYAHNGSGYDWIFFLKELARRGIPFSAYKTGGRFFLTVEGRDFLDSMVIIKGSLARACQDLGVRVHKLAVPDDFFPRIKHYWRKGLAKEYLERDCRALHECIQLLRQAFSSFGGQMKATIASTALDLFRREFLTREIVGLPWWSPIERDVRAAMAGGRVEVFKPTMGKGWGLDINSSYPHKMLGPMPTNYAKSGRGDWIPDCGVAFARVSIPHSETIPPLHIRHGERLFFPTGEWGHWYTADELRYARELYGNTAVTVERWHAFEPDAIFTDYVRVNYAERQRAKKAGQKSVAEGRKLALNTLFGKTGTKRDRQKIVCGEEYHGYPFNDPKAMRQIQKHGGISNTNRRALLVSQYSEELQIYGIPHFVEHAPYILPAIAATITAQGRIHWHRLATRDREALAYGDTDSLYTSASLDTYSEDISDEIGGLKVEHEIISGEFALPKVYALETKEGSYAKAKGLPLKDVAEVKRYMRGEAVQFKRIVGAIESLRRRGDFHLESELATKQLSGTAIPKRHPDGRAYRVDELSALGVG